MEIDHVSKGPSRLFKGCAIVGVLAIVGLIMLLMYLMKMPSIRDIMLCRTNMVSVGNAIGRYYDFTGSYPTNLSDIKKEYLANPAVLRCPLDKSEDNKPSYKYNRPGPNAGDKFVILECDRHRLMKDMPVSKLILYKNGMVEMEKPDMKAIEEKNRKK